MATPSTPPVIDILYAAHTASCTFLLDSEGICRRIVIAPKGKRSTSRTAVRCVGAQYVASLDGSAAGGLVEMPRVGAAMLFARVDERGRISLVRTGVVTSFESKAGEDPFVESGTVETSAPEIQTPRVRRPSAPPPTMRQADPDYDDDPSERTQRIHALRSQDIAAALGLHELQHDEAPAGNDLATAEYRSVPDDQLAFARRTPAPVSTAPTLRNPHRDTMVDDDSDAYARNRTPVPVPTPPRGVLPRQRDPRMRAAAAPTYSTDPRPTPRAYSSDIQVSRRRRTP